MAKQYVEFHLSSAKKRTIEDHFDILLSHLQKKETLNDLSVMTEDGENPYLVFGPFPDDQKNKDLEKELKAELLKIKYEIKRVTFSFEI